MPWKHICAELMPEPDQQKALLAARFEFGEHLRRAPDMGRDMGASPEILQRAMGRCMEIIDKRSVGSAVMPKDS
jgi:serine/threonine-protein kinase HipA